MYFPQTDTNYGIYPQSPGEGSSWEVSYGVGTDPFGLGGLQGMSGGPPLGAEGIRAAQRAIDSIMAQYGILPEGLPDWVYDVAGGLGQPGGPSEEMNIQFDPVTGLPIYDPTSPVIFERTVQMPEQEVGGGGDGGGAPRRPTTTTTTTGSAASSGDYGGTGTGVRQITLPTGQVITVPENLNPFQLLTQGFITREIYEQLAGDSAIPEATPEIVQSTSPVETETGDPLRRPSTDTETSTDTEEPIITDIEQTVTTPEVSDVSDLSGGGLRRNMNEEDEFEDGEGLGTGTGTGTGDNTGDGTGTGTGTGGTASVVFNPYQPTLSPFELGEYGRLIPSTQSGVLPELADFMNYYGASVPGMTQQMANVTGRGQTAYAQQVLGMEGDDISAFDIAQEASRQQRGALGDVFGLGPDATYANIVAKGTEPMKALTQTRETVLPGLQSAFQTAQERLEQGLTGRERQQVEQATRARFGALGRGADTAALATEIGDIMQEERGLYSRNLQDLLGIGQATGSLIGQEAYAMSPFTQAAIGSADLGPGLALAGDIGRQAAAATPSPTDLFGLEAGERQFGLDIDALEAAAEAGDLNVVSNMLSTIGSAFRGGPNAGLQQQQPMYTTGTYTGQPLRYF